MRHLFAALLLVLTACAREIHTHGYEDLEGARNLIQQGQDTPETVEKKLGTPSLVDGHRWDYIKLVEEAHGICRPKIKEHKRLVVWFNKKGTVEKTLLEDIQDQRVPFATGRTKTGGYKEGLFKDIFGKIGQSRGPIA